MSKQWTEEELSFLKENYKDMTYKELSEKMNRSKAAIDLKINRLGLKKEKYTYNKDYFSEIDTPEKAYWLGFIYADGCVSHNAETNSSELSIKLQHGDKDHLKKFNKAIEGNVGVSEFTRECNLNGKMYDSCQIRLYANKIVEDLSKHGIYPDKSLTIQFPKINEEFQSHFIRGFFDGDGCLTKSNHKNGKSYVRADFTCGSIAFVESLREILNYNNIKSYVSKEEDKNYYRLVIGGMINTDKFFNYIYQDAQIYLDRKFKKKNNLYNSLNIEQRLLLWSEKTSKKQ